MSGVPQRRGHIVGDKDRPPRSPTSDLYLIVSKLGEKGVELPVFASPTIAGVTLHDTDLIYGQYQERMILAQTKHLDFFKERMKGVG